MKSTKAIDAAIAKAEAEGRAVTRWPKVLRDDMSEDDFLTLVIETAQSLGWHVAHFRPGRTAKGGWVTAVSGDGKGFPDLVLVKNRILYRELKSNAGTISNEQLEWLLKIEVTGGDAAVWRPRDWPTILEQLRA